MKKFLSLILVLILALSTTAFASENIEIPINNSPEFVEHMGKLKDITSDKLEIITEYGQVEEYKISHKTTFFKNTGNFIEWEKMNLGDKVKIYELQEGIALSVISYGNRGNLEGIPSVSLHISEKYSISEDGKLVTYTCDNGKIEITTPISNIFESWNDDSVDSIVVPSFIFLAWYDSVLDRDIIDEENITNIKQTSSDKIVITKYLSQEPLLIFKDNNKLLASYVDKNGTLQEKDIGEYKVVNNTKYVPLRLALENLGDNYKVNWNSQNGEIYIYYNDKKFCTSQDSIELYTQGIIAHMDSKILVENGTAYISSKALSQFFDIGNIYVS